MSQHKQRPNVITNHGLIGTVKELFAKKFEDIEYLKEQTLKKIGRIIKQLRKPPKKPVETRTTATLKTTYLMKGEIA